MASLLITGLLLAMAACPGPPNPPSADLTTATAATADTVDMFEYSLEATIETKAPNGQSRQSVTKAEGSARNREGYLETVSTDPAPAGGVSPLVLIEMPGGVRKPGDPYWFSGRSGAMEAFGPLAEALPPLGPPQTVNRRFDAFASSAGANERITGLGVTEVRGHSVDTYTFPIVDASLTAPLPSATPTNATTPTASGSQSPSPTQATKTPTLPEATSLLLAEIAQVPPSALGTGAGRISASAEASVDQINGRLRRIRTFLEASRYGASIRVDAVMDIWGFDPSGNYNEPIDTTFVGPAEQALIRNSAFQVVAPYSLPQGIQFTGLASSGDGVGSCRALQLDLTGRGREGFVGVLQTGADCPPLKTPQGQSLVTETATGESVTYVKEGDQITIRKTVGATVATMTAKQGVTLGEALQMAATLRPMSIPLPPQLSLPLPTEGPERR